MRYLVVALLCAAAVPAVAQEAPKPFPQDTPQTRSIDYGDFYYQRLAVHRIGSYAVLPLFAGEFLLGQKLIKGGAEDWVKPTHQVVAGAIGALFVTNTITGAWNLWDSRKDPENRTKRFVHAALMLGANAGFAYTGLVASQDASDLDEGADRHRAAALTSMGVATLGTILMWLWND